MKKRNWYTDPPKTGGEHDKMRKDDVEAILAAAYAYLVIDRCKLCGQKAKVRGYICSHCKGDDTITS